MHDTIPIALSCTASYAYSRYNMSKKAEWFVHSEIDITTVEEMAEMYDMDVDDIDPDETGCWEISVMNYKWNSSGWDDVFGEDKLIIGSSDDYGDEHIPHMQKRAHLIADAWNKAGIT